MIPTSQTHLVVAGPSDGWKYISIEMLLRLFRNIDHVKLSEELVSSVYDRRISYLTFKEEMDSINSICRVLFPSNNPGIINGNVLHVVLRNGYLIADEKLKKLGLAQF